MVLLGGEPGSGKSRLVREFAAEAARAGALVLYGACDAVVHAPYGPFSQALERLAARARRADELRDALGASGGELIRLLPRPRRAARRTFPPPARADPDTERHRLHTVVTDLLERVGRRRPVVLVIEDGHWADAPTLLLLRHLAQTAWSGADAPVRDLPRHRGGVPARRSPRRSPTCAAPTTWCGCGSAGSPTRRWASSCGASPRARAGASLPELAAAISELTGGNPFLMCELWRALRRDRRDLDRGRRASARRLRCSPSSGPRRASARSSAPALGRLAPATTELLELAATAGAEFEPAIARTRRRSSPSVSWSRRSTRRPAAASSSSCPAASSPTGSATSSCAGPSTTACRACAAPSCTCGSARRWRRPGGYSARVARGPRPPLHRRRRRSTVSSGRSATTSSPPGRPPTRSPSTRPPSCSWRPSSSGSRTRGRAPRCCSSSAWSGTRPARRPRRCEALDGRRRRSPASSATPSCWRARRPDTRRRAGGRGRSSSTPSSCSKRRRRRSATRSPSCASSCSAGSPARSTCAASRSAGAIVRANALALARRLDDRAGLATVLVRSYWSRGATPIAEILEMLTEARALGEELLDTELQAEAMVVARAGVRRDRPTSPPREEVDATCGAWPRSPGSRSTCTSPSTTGPRSRSRTGDLEAAEAMAHALRAGGPAC